jgi:hypothetical protein
MANWMNLLLASLYKFDCRLRNDAANVNVWPYLKLETMGCEEDVQ